MKIHTITTNYMGSQSYLLIEGDHAVIIDLGDPDTIIQIVHKENINIDFCILTHEHCDHILGCSKVRDEFKCKVYASSRCDENMRDSRRNFSQYYNAFIDMQTKLPIEYQKKIYPFTDHADIVFSDELTIEWLGYTMYICETPGHSQGSICVLVDDKYLFSGDTLLKENLTGVGYIGSNKEQLIERTVPWLKSLSKDLLVYPGHGEQFQLCERLKNPII